MNARAVRLQIAMVTAAVAVSHFKCWLIRQINEILLEIGNCFIIKYIILSVVCDYSCPVENIFYWFWMFVVAGDCSLYWAFYLTASCAGALAIMSFLSCHAARRKRGRGNPADVWIVMTSSETNWTCSAILCLSDGNITGSSFFKDWAVACCKHKRRQRLSNHWWIEELQKFVTTISIWRRLHLTHVMCKRDWDITFTKDFAIDFVQVHVVVVYIMSIQFSYSVSVCQHFRPFVIKSKFCKCFNATSFITHLEVLSPVPISHKVIHALKLWRLKYFRKNTLPYWRRGWRAHIIYYYMIIYKMYVAPYNSHGI